VSSACAVVLNWNQAKLALEAAASVEGAVETVILVDNGSAPEERALLAAAATDRGYTMIQSEVNLGYAAGNNLAFTPEFLSDYDYFLLMNSDAAALPGGVERLRSYLTANPRVAAVIPTVIAPDTAVVHHTSCTVLPIAARGRWDDCGISLDAVSGGSRETGCISGEAVMIRAEALRECGGFDARFFCYFEDTEWSVRVRRAGWRLAVEPSAVFTHIVGASGVAVFGAYYRARNHVLFQRIGLQRPRFAAAAVGAALLAQPVWRNLVRRRELGAVRALINGWLAGVRMDIRAEA